MTPPDRHTARRTRVGSGLPAVLADLVVVHVPEVGTVVTGTFALAVRSGSTLLTALSIVLFVGLLGAWLVVAARTAAGAWTGILLHP